MHPRLDVVSVEFRGESVVDDNFVLSPLRFFVSANQTHWDNGLKGRLCESLLSDVRGSIGSIARAHRAKPEIPAENWQHVPLHPVQLVKADQKEATRFGGQPMLTSRLLESA